MNRNNKVLLVAAAATAIDNLRKLKANVIFTNSLDIDILNRLIDLMSNDEIIKCQMYYEEVIPRMTCSTFRSHFRMTPMTFEAILVEIADKPEFAKRDENLYGGCEQVNPEKCLLVALWTLATPDSYRSIGDRFNINVDVSWPGSVHDARVFRTSDLYLRGQNLCQRDYFILADSAYPCLTWIIPPFKNNGHLTPMQVYFNTILSKIRVNSENAFALLKGRFRRIRNLLDRNNVQEICETIVACCVLHNICLVKGGEDILDFVDEGRQNNADIPMEYGWQNNDEYEGSIRRDEIMLQLWNNRQNI